VQLLPAASLIWRFKRKTLIVSKSKAMVDLTMALFAKFWVNGNQDELQSLLG
jgi:hypothetical protein